MLSNIASWSNGFYFVRSIKIKKRHRWFTLSVIQSVIWIRIPSGLVGISLQESRPTESNLVKWFYTSQWFLLIRSPCVGLTAGGGIGGRVWGGGPTCPYTGSVVLLLADREDDSSLMNPLPPWPLPPTSPAHHRLAIYQLIISTMNLNPLTFHITILITHRFTNVFKPMDKNENLMRKSNAN